MDVTAELVNVGIEPEHALGLPIRLDLYYASLKELDNTKLESEFSPVHSGRATVTLGEGYANVDDAKRALAWYAELLAFATRRPTGVLGYSTTAQGVEGPSWEVGGLPRFARRVGARMYRGSGDLRLFVERALAKEVTWLEATGVEHALVWQNLSRREAGLQYMDIRLLHQWVPLEILATRWAESSGRGELLSAAQVEAFKAATRSWVRERSTDPERRAEVYSKLGELRRRPAVPVLLDFIRNALGPFGAQPTGPELESLVRRSVAARNQAVHAGAVDFEATDGSSGAHRDLMKVAGITERVLLALLDVPIAYLTDVPWTVWRSGA